MKAGTTMAYAKIAKTKQQSMKEINNINCFVAGVAIVLVLVRTVANKIRSIRFDSLTH